MLNPNKKFLITFSLLALVVWSFGWWGYELYMYVVHIPGFSQARFMNAVVTASLLIILAYLVFRVVTLRKNRPAVILRYLALDAAGICFVGLYALLISIIRNNSWDFVLNFFKGDSGYTLQTLIPSLLDAEGLDTIFSFFLALISGYIIYTPSEKFPARDFFKLLTAWFVIIFISEMLIQGFFLTERTSSMYDVFNNMFGGVLIGLLLSIKKSPTS